MMGDFGKGKYKPSGGGVRSGWGVGAWWRGVWGVEGNWIVPIGPTSQPAPQQPKTSFGDQRNTHNLKNIGFLGLTPQTYLMISTG